MSSGTETAASRLSSSWAKALAAGGVLAAAAVVAGVVLLRGDDDAKAKAARRAAVATYIVKVNQVQQTLILELDRVSSVYRKLRIRAKPEPGQLERLETSGATLETLREKIAELPAPPEATALRAELLKLLDVQVAIAGEVTGLVRYLPIETAAQRQFAAATGRLRRELAAAGTPGEQEAAFAVYRKRISGISARLSRADAPDVVEPSRTAEIARLRAVVGITQQIGRALAERRVKDVEALFRHFARTSSATGTTPAERAAIVAFNRRLQATVEQRKRLTAERVRLQYALS